MTGQIYFENFTRLPETVRYILWRAETIYHKGNQAPTEKLITFDEKGVVE